MFERIKGVSWVGWTAILAGAVALLTLPSLATDHYREQQQLHGPFALSPWMNADAVETKVAMEEFNSRETLSRPFLWHRSMALVGILLFYVIGPGLLILFGIGTSSRPHRRRPSVSFHVGLALVLAGVVNLGVAATLPRLAAEQARKENTNQKVRDQMSREVLRVGHAAYQHFALPDSLGGGGGSFRGIAFGDIEAELSFSLAPYQLHVESDTLLRITGTEPTPRPSAGNDSIRVVARSRPSNVLEIRPQSE